MEKIKNYFHYRINAVFLPLDNNMAVKVKYFLEITFFIAVFAHIILVVYFLLIRDLQYMLACSSGILLFAAGLLMSRAGKTRAASLFYACMILLNSLMGMYLFGLEAGAQWMPIIILLPVIIYLDLSKTQKICLLIAVPILMNLHFILPENFFPPGRLESAVFLQVFFVNMIVFSTILAINSNRILSRIALELRQKELEKHKLSSKAVHDVKNQLYAVISRLDSGDIAYAFKKLQELCSELSSELSSDISNVQCVSATGIKALDALINAKFQMASGAGIAFSLKSFTSEENSIDDMDLCILIGNALDNAIEACERMESGNEKFIKLAIMQIENNLSISLINSSGGEDSGEKHEFVTLKNDKELHGFGLTKMHEIVSKYTGYIEYSLRNREFHLKALMPNPPK